MVSVARTQHLVLRMQPGDNLPDTLLAALRARKATGGFVSLSGVLADVELRAYSAELEGPGGTKRLTGAAEAIVLEGSFGVANGDVALDLRVVVARETDRGLETLGGQLVRARVVGLEGSMTILDDTIIPRAVDKSAGVRLLRDDAIVTAVAPEGDPSQNVPPPPPSGPAIPPPSPSWSDAVAASAGGAPARPTGAPGTFAKPPRKIVESDDGPYPVAGDTVEHFAFGGCEVLKSDGDRLHVRMKDGRIREIAIEMLKVTPLGADPSGQGSSQRYRLDRKL